MGRRRFGAAPASLSGPLVPFSDQFLSDETGRSVDAVPLSPASLSGSALRACRAEPGRTFFWGVGEALRSRPFHGHTFTSIASRADCTARRLVSWSCWSTPNSWNIWASSSTACWMIFRRLAEWFSRPPILWSAALRTLPMLSLRALCSCSCAASTSTTFFSSLPKRAPSSSRIDSSTSFASTLDCCSSCLPLSSSSSPTLLISTAFFAPALLHSATTPSVAEIFLLMTSTSLAKTLSSAALALSNDSWICFCSSPCLLSRSSALASSCPPFADSSLVSFAFVSSKS
mmetsp:Transcript_51857/g.139839  ORF Transcript_51857/g.139839 Transcript_51857/m.139839 type:complete len:287 (+) Transcript_51857:614-1474(+)